VHARDGRQSESWKSALETVDQLLWSVAPKPTPEERRKLPGVIPGLLKRVKLGVAAGGVDEAVATAFFGEMMKLHTDVMRPPPAAPPTKRKEKEKAVAASAAGTPARPQPAPDAKPAPAPAEAKDGHGDLLDFTAPITLNNPFGEGKVDVSAEDLDFTAAPGSLSVETAPPSAAPGAAPAPHRGGTKPRDTIRLPSGMVVGAWVEIIEAAGGEHRHPAKLHYVSPMKSHFLFVDRRGKKVYECSRSMLARRLKLGEMWLLDGEPDSSLFDRILEGLFGKLGAAAPA